MVLFSSTKFCISMIFFGQWKMYRPWIAEYMQPWEIAFIRQRPDAPEGRSANWSSQSYLKQPEGVTTFLQDILFSMCNEHIIVNGDLKHSHTGTEKICFRQITHCVLRLLQHSLVHVEKRSAYVGLFAGQPAPELPQGSGIYKDKCSCSPVGRNIILWLVGLILDVGISFGQNWTGFFAHFSLLGGIPPISSCV